MGGGVSAASSDDGNTAEQQQEESLRYLQSLDQRVAEIAWRLSESSTDVCPDKRGSLGISLHDAAQYDPQYRPAAIAAFGFGDGLPTVLTLADESPARRAGIEMGDRIASIDGVELVPHTVNPDSPADYEAVEKVMAKLDAAPAGTGVRLGLLRGQDRVSVTVVPQSLCDVHVELVPGGKINADSDGRNVQIHGRLATWVRDDNELALVIAHEMAHNFLAHQERLEREGIGTGLFSGFGRNGRKLRDMERAADRYGIFMAARAGYDYRIAGTFWRRLAREGGLGALWATTHPSARNRGRNADAAVEEVEKLQHAGLALTP